MAKKSMIYREIKRAKLVEKYAEIRVALKAIINSEDTSLEEKVIDVGLQEDHMEYLVSLVFQEI